jgi:hypothetical protein
MKKNALLLCLALVMPLAHVGCQQAPSERVAVAQTLLAVGHSAEATVGISAQLYRDKKISPKQAADIARFYDTRFLPVFRAAVTAAKSDLSTLASPDVLKLASDLSALLAEATKQPRP